MRQLPPKPNLDHLRQQAKDLLAAQRETDPSATLSGAQRSLALRYGYRAWTDLKAEVERRSLASATPDQGLVAALCHEFGLGYSTSPGMVTANESQGPRVDLDTSTGRWTAHRVFGWVDENQVHRSMPLLDAARQAGVVTPTPRRTPGGRWTVEIDGERWRVDEWMELGPTLISPAPTATVRVVGELLGQLHSLGIEATSPMVPWLTRRQSDTEWKQAATLVAKRPWAEQFDAALGHIVDINRIEATGATPHILSHTNLVHSTVRRGPEDSLVVVEWDFVGPTAPDWELGGALYTWSVEEGTVDTKRAQVLIEGYRSTGAVPPTFEPSIFATAISAWLNQLSSRMTVAVWASDDPVEQERADAEVTAMLTFPMTCQLLDDLLDAMR